MHLEWKYAIITEHHNKYSFERRISMNLIVAIFLPILAALFVPLLFKKVKQLHTGWFVLLIPLSLFFFYASFIQRVANGDIFSSTFHWVESLQLSFISYIDGLSLLFSLLITGIGSLVVLYSIFYLDKSKEQLHNFYVYLLLFMSAMLGVVQSDNVITLYLFWELTSISSFLLIAYWFNRDASRFGALKSMMITVFGGLLMLGGFVLLSMMGDTYSIRELIAQAPQLAQHDYFTWALVLLLFGAFTKSAQGPFYIWLPDAMEAPTPVSAYLHSATMVKAGIYLVARFTPIFAVSELWIWLVTGTGLFTLAWCSFFALKQTDLKGILAFSTVSQLGLIMSLLGAGAMSYHVDGAAETVFKYAAFAAIFHLINHATFKGSLFMIVGIIDHETGTRDIKKLGGLMSLMPISFTVAMIGSLSMAGVPLFNGFLSKEMFLTAMLSIKEFGLFSFDTFGVLFPIIAWVASVFTFAYSLYFVTHTFFGKYKPEQLPKKAHEAPIGMLVSPIVLAVLVVTIFFIPNVVATYFIKPAVLAIQPFLYNDVSQIDVHISAWHGFNDEFWMTLGIFAVGTLIIVTLKKWQHFYNRVPAGLNMLYDAAMEFSDSGMNRLSRLYMTGSNQTYLLYMFASFVVLVLGTLYTQGGFVFDTSNVAPIRAYDVVLVALLVCGTLIALVTKSRLTSIIGLGVVGYSVAMFFVLFNAPDLALTQLVIETISVALFLLCFYHLPKNSRTEKRIRFKLSRFAVSFGVGATVTIVAIAAQSQKMMTSISEYYKETVYSLAGGGNIVNVILVDYRGFDTLFEIAVLAIAGLGIFAVIKLRLGEGKEKKQFENK